VQAPADPAPDGVNWNSHEGSFALRTRGDRRHRRDGRTSRHPHQVERDGARLENSTRDAEPRRKTKDMDGFAPPCCAGQSDGSRTSQARPTARPPIAARRRRAATWTRRSCFHSLQPPRSLLVFRVVPVMNLGAQAPRPNPSLEARPNGIALGPRSALVHDALRGPSAIPSVPPQLER
jgi:hypothetical protein